jgi:hypothetical protein
MPKICFPHVPKYKNKYHPAIYMVYCVQFADGPMSRAFGDVYRNTCLSSLAYNCNFLRATHCFSSRPSTLLNRTRVACRLIVHLSWGTSHSRSSVTSHTPHDRLCAPLPPTGWKVYVRRRNPSYAIPSA